VTAGLVARVGDHTVTLGELEGRLAAIRSGPLGPRLPQEGTPAGKRLRRWVAQLLATEALVRHEARQLAPPVPDANHGVTEAVRDLFTHVTADVAVDEAEVRRYYLANSDLWDRPERRTIRQAVRPTRRQAAAMRTEEMEPPETLMRGQLSGPLEDAVFAARPGERIGPVKTVFGWHSAVLESVEPAGVVPYEAVSDTIGADLLAAAQGSAFDDWFALRRAELIDLAHGFEHPGDPSVPDHVHRH
jgi:[acyl-carrier-protein] S-malonyltransferase